MKLLHHKLDRSIKEMESVVCKGVPFAKRNKHRRIRAILRDMNATQTQPPVLKELYFYFKHWLTSRYTADRQN